jgi:hypothetical protein
MSAFEKLPREARLAHHNLWKHHHLNEQITEDTRAYFVKNPQFLVDQSHVEIDNPFSLGAFGDSDNINYSPTPTYQSDTESDHESNIDSASPFTDNIPTCTSDHRVLSYSSIDMSNVDDLDEERSTNSTVSKPRCGFYGKPKSIANPDLSFFVSNQKLLRLSSSQSLD